ncbi:MAG: hypothetical protein JWM02_1405 [Frankiales bacterium]|nr:hypothetical protein [Frankiales bacterium]
MDGRGHGSDGHGQAPQEGPQVPQASQLAPARADTGGLARSGAVGSVHATRQTNPSTLGAYSPGARKAHDDRWGQRPKKVPKCPKAV